MEINNLNFYRILLMKAPSKHKIAFITWLAIYPLITLILYLFGSDLEQLPLAVRTLILTLVLVPVMVYVMVPGLQKLFRKWMN